MQLSLVCFIVTQTRLEVIAVFVCTMNRAAEVITTIDDIPYPWEACLIAAAAVRLSADIYLGMS